MKINDKVKIIDIPRYANGEPMNVPQGFSMDYTYTVVRMEDDGCVLVHHPELRGHSGNVEGELQDNKNNWWLRSCDLAVVE